ncbi:MAG: methanogenesis marker 2 protein [Methanocellales archaeon]|nr:methanogenesis marker 2 protein [Methanocellales archaeon]
MMLNDLATSLREFEGVRRKRAIEALVRWFACPSNAILASFGEDAAIIDHGEEALLIAADGIWSKVMDADPYWAGYCSVLVNIHDIAAMGGQPVAMVNVFSGGKRICDSVAKGMSEAAQKFDIPMVGGHIHPDVSYNAIDVSIVGTVKKDSVVYSHTANMGDDIIVGIDLEGRIHPSCELNWDSTTDKDTSTLRAQIGSMQVLGESHLVTAGKNISNPGMLGTLGMLLEMSSKGAIVDLKAIPKPPEISMEHWLKVYPGMGFIVTARPKNTDEITATFEEHRLSASVIGKIAKGSKLEITDGDEYATIFDFRKDKITGLRRADHG